MLRVVTKSGTNQDFYIRHMGGNPFGGHMAAHQPPQFGFNRPQPFGQQPSAFNHHGMHVQHHQFHRPALPTIFYLFTSMDMGHEPYWSQTPVCVPKGAAIPPIPRDFTYHIGWYVVRVNWTLCFTYWGYSGIMDSSIMYSYMLRISQIDYSNIYVLSHTLAVCLQHAAM